MWRAAAAKAELPSVHSTTSGASTGAKTAVSCALSLRPRMKSVLAPERSRTTKTGHMVVRRCRASRTCPHADGAGARCGAGPCWSAGQKVSSASTMPVSLPALASRARARKRWRQRNALLGAASSVFAAAWMLSPWLSTWAQHLDLRQPFALVAQARHRRARQRVEGVGAGAALVALQAVGLAVSNNPRRPTVRARRRRFPRPVNKRHDLCLGAVPLKRAVQLRPLNKRQFVHLQNQLLPLALSHLGLRIHTACRRDPANPTTLWLRA